MRSPHLVCCALLALTATGCAPSPVEVCQRMVDQICDRTFECRTDKDTAEFQTTYGLTVGDCQAKFYIANGCSKRESAEQNCTGPNAGKSQFNASRFEACQEALDELSCRQYLDQQSGVQTPPSECLDVCS